MIPVFGCEGVACFVAIAWNSEHMAEFLAWWMPVNLIAYLVFIAFCAVNFGVKKEATELKRLLLVMFVTLPFLFFLSWLWVFDELIYKPKRRSKRKAEAYQNHLAYVKILNSHY